MTEEKNYIMDDEHYEKWQEIKLKNWASDKKCSNCIYYVENYVDDFTVRHFGYGEVKIRPACSHANTYGFVSSNPASWCSWYKEHPELKKEKEFNDKLELAFRELEEKFAELKQENECLKEKLQITTNADKRTIEILQENKELQAYKDINEDFKKAWDELNEKYKQLRSALEEIRNTLNKIFNVCDDDCGNANKITKIVDKIKEVLNDK